MASKRHAKRKACTGKKAYSTWAAAWADMRKVVAGGAIDNMEVYQCPYANHFHFGHQSQRRKSQAR